jgi:hypothetical protein
MRSRADHRVTGRLVGVVVRSAKAAEALRGAVGLAGGGLQVRVLLLDQAAHLPPSASDIHKHFHMLLTLGHEVWVEGERAQDAAGAQSFQRTELPRLLAECDALEGW